MSELPFDPFEMESKPRRANRPASAASETPLWVMQQQLKTELFGWLFYGLGLMLLLACIAYGLLGLTGGNLLDIGLVTSAAWIALFLQYRWPIGGARRTPNRNERRLHATPGYRFGQGCTICGTLVGVLASMALYALESTAAIVACVVGQLTAVGMIAWGQKLIHSAKRRAAELSSA